MSRQLYMPIFNIPEYYITQFEFCMGGDNSTFQNWIISNFNFQQQKQSAKIIRIKLYEFE